MTLEQVRGVIFDVDGVLLDARPSYWATAELGARRALAGVIGADAAARVPFDRDPEIAAFKAAGRFNDDWEMARAIAILLSLRARGDAPALADFLARAEGRGIAGLAAAYPREAALFPAAAMARLCGAIYGGPQSRDLFGFDSAEPRGLWENETVLPDRALLEAAMLRFPFALFTGRNPGEARLAQKLCGLRIRDELCWVSDGRPRKPDCAGLVWLVHKLLRGAKGAQALFLGDTADDQAAARAAQDRGAPLIYAHIEQPGDTSRVLARLLAETGATRA